MESRNISEEQAQIWISVPQKHKRTTMVLAISGGVLLLGALLIGGYKVCMIAGIVMAAATILVHFLLQKRITLAHIIFYFIRGKCT